MTNTPTPADPNHNEGTYFAYSVSEFAYNNRAGFWSKKHGWTTATLATVFTAAEVATLQLPPCAGNDAKWVLITTPV